MASREQESPRKAYEPPLLTVYGKVHEITRTVGGRTNPDGGTIPGNTFTRIAGG